MYLLLLLMMYVKSTYNGKISIFIVFNKPGIHAMVAYRFKCKQNNDDHETAEYIHLKSEGEIRSFVETGKRPTPQCPVYSLH